MSIRHAKARTFLGRELPWVDEHYAKNARYSRMVGRHKLFERERHSEPIPGLHACDLASAASLAFPAPTKRRSPLSRGATYGLFLQSFFLTVWNASTAAVNCDTKVCKPVGTEMPYWYYGQLEKSSRLGTMSFPQSFSRFSIVVFATSLFLISAARVAASTSLKGLSASPLSVSFGTIQVGSSQTQHEALTNSGNSTVTISKATVTGAGFSLGALTLPLSLKKGQSVTFDVLFTPTLGGSTRGGIAVVSNAVNAALNIALSGTGISSGRLNPSATNINFGSATVGTSKTLTVTVTATGSSVKISSATSTSPEFRMGGISVPTTIAVGRSASFTLTFTPQAGGTASGSISLNSNAVNTPTVEKLTGSGTAAHSVSLSWNPSPSAVVGYNVYRSATSGGLYTKLNSVLNASTSYIDASAKSGATYYYVSTAVAGSGSESTYSNQVRAVIPSP